MREKAEEMLYELDNCPNWMFRLVEQLKTDSKKLKEEVMEGYVPVRVKEVKSARII